jgi:hypothetical protein
MGLRLVLAGLLLVCAARFHAARADDETSVGDDSSGSFDPADANLDGTVTRREGRRYRRKLRRAGRAPGSHDGGDAAGDAEGGGDEPSVSEAASGAMARAVGAASALTASLAGASAGDLPAGAGRGSGAMGAASGPGAAARAGGGAGGAGLNAAASAGAAVAAGAAGGGASQPPEAALLAQRGGYSGAFAAAGLKLGADGRTVVRLDGSPPTAADWARLRGTLGSMPRALERRPDFFDVISPGHFSDLKRGYHEHPELGGTVYKHIGTTADERDLAHTASCDKVSGDCNAFVEKASYKKGELVAPEDLKKLWDELEKETAGEGGGPRELESGPASLEGPRAIAAAGGAVEDASGAPAASRTATRAAGSRAKDEKASSSRAPSPVFAAAARWVSSLVPFSAGGAAGTRGGSGVPWLGALGAGLVAAFWLLAGRKGD